MNTLQKTGLVILGLIIIIGGGYYFLKNSPAENGLISETNTAPLWVEVISSNVSSVNKDGVSRVIHSGDEVIPGEIVITDIKGRAVIHLPEGSVLRIEEDSKLVINSAQFNSKDEGLIVETTLIAGRVWSKVVALVTPESRWEVKTSNAVATVRGTSFGVGYRNGRSRIVGSENKIKVSPIDPKTQKVVEKTEREIIAGKFIEIKDEDIDAILLKPETMSQPLAIATAPRDVLDWNSRNEIADRDINQKIEIIKKEGLNDKETRNVLRKETEDLKEKIKTLKLEKSTDEEINKEIRKEGIKEFKERLKINIQELKEEGLIQTETTNTTNETSATGNGGTGTIIKPTDTTITPTSKPVKIEIAGITTGQTVKDAQKITIKTILIFSDGSRKDVALLVIWKINGNIGSIDKGIFTAKIRDENSELPEIKGSIQAVYQEGDLLLTSGVVDIIVVPNVDETTPVG